MKGQDIIYISGLEVEAVVGVNDWERKTRQTVRLDLEFAHDNRKAAGSDRLEDATDYKAIKKRLTAFIAESEFFLIETLAERIAQLLIGEFGLSWIKLRLGKPGALSGSLDVGVLIERTAADHPLEPDRRRD